MLRGRFGDTTGRPYFEGRLVLSDLKLTADISFILDTGADSSVLMPLDSRRMGVDYSVFDETIESVGIGGISKDFKTPAILAFSDSGNLYVYAIPELRVMTPSPEILNIPSLLGRDIIDRWSLTYDKPNNNLRVDVDTCDTQIDLTPPIAMPDTDP